MALFKIAGGTVYDPANGVEGAVTDLWIEDGRIVAPPSDPAAKADKTLHADGLVVMPGGIDMPHENKETMFELPRVVIKSGRVIVEQGEIREDFYGKTLHVAPDYDRAIEPDIASWFEKYYSVRFRNYPVGDEYLKDQELVACGS